MLSSLKKIVQWIWAAPVSLPCFLGYVLPCWILGWYKPLRWEGDAYVFVTGDMPTWLTKLWAPWKGQCAGNVVIMNLDLESELGVKMLRHELVHTKQVMTWGILQPLMYNLSSVAARMTGNDPYRTNHFEMEAYKKQNITD